MKLNSAGINLGENVHLALFDCDLQTVAQGLSLLRYKILFCPPHGIAENYNEII